MMILLSERFVCDSLASFLSWTLPTGCSNFTYYRYLSKLESWLNSRLQLDGVSSIHLPCRHITIHAFFLGTLVHPFGCTPSLCVPFLYHKTFLLLDQTNKKSLTIAKAKTIVKPKANNSSRTTNLCIFVTTWTDTRFFVIFCLFSPDLGLF